MMKGSDISETSRFISALNIFLSCVVARCLSPKFQTMPVSGLVSQGGQNVGLEASCQYGQIFEMAELNNNDCDYKVCFRGMIQKYKFIKERNNNESGYEVGFRSIIRKYEPLLHIASSAQTISGQEGHKRKLL